MAMKTVRWTETYGSAVLTKAILPSNLPWQEDTHDVGLNPDMIVHTLGRIDTLGLVSLLGFLEPQI